MNVVIAVTGASGAIYAKRLIERIAMLEGKIAVVFSENAEQVWKWELGQPPVLPEKVIPFHYKDFSAPFASGSSDYDSMVICPASMGTIGRIASGISDSLITRAADVMLKENRKLVLVPREMPYNLIHIENFRTLILSGAIIIPASPSFYSKPTSIMELIDTVIDKIFMQLEINFKRFKWGSDNKNFYQ